MAGDRSRISYSQSRKYREVVSQQGRVLLEADSNEGQRIFSEEVRHHTLDFVGPCGTPDDGYKITAPPADFQIGPGTMYVSGIRTTLEQTITYTKQPDWLDTAQPQPWTQDLFRPVNQLTQGSSNVILLLREQEITAVEDPALREVALGGPDSAARTRLLQRIAAIPLEGSTCAAAAAAFPAFWSSLGLVYNPKTAELLSRARLQVSMVQTAPPPSPCDPPSASGYLGADNQLIRVQVVEFDAVKQQGKLLWGYHNASTLYRVKALDATTLELASRPVAGEFEPKSGQIAQVLSSAAEIAPPSAGAFPDGAYAAALTGHRAKLNAAYAAETRRVTLPAVLPAIFPLASTTPPLFLRLWEEELLFDLNAPIILTGTGLQVTITAASAGPLYLGDYWSIAVRPLTPNAVYSERYLISPQPPDGPRMWTCSLAVMRPSAAGGVAGFQVEDCRVPFDPLTTPTTTVDNDCCCIKVTPKQASTLQNIIDKAAQSGQGANVAIHLEPGEYKLRSPLLLDQRHKGIIIEACTGVKPVISGSEDPRFANGMIIAIKAEQVTLRGLEFRMLPVKLTDEMRDLMEKVGKEEIPNFGSPPRLIGIGVRAVQCLSLSIEDCDFRLPKDDATFALGVLIQGDNGNIEITGCRFDGVNTDSIGVCLAPALVNVDGVLRHSSVEILRVTGCVFARLRVAILLSSRPLLTFIEGNVTRYVFTSLLVLWYEDKVRRVKQVMDSMDVKNPTAMVKDFLADFKQDTALNRIIAESLLLPLGELGSAAGDRLEFLYSLVDLPIDEATQAKMSAPASLQLTLRDNQFDSRLATGQGGPDTLIWDLVPQTSALTITGNTIRNSSDLPTLVTLQLRAFNVTGNVISNEQIRGNDKDRPAFLVLPSKTGSANRPGPNLFTVTGNTIFGLTNLSEFPRMEWTTQLPEAFLPLLTWEFFNTIIDMGVL